MFASIGRACYRHRRAVALGWLALFVLGVVLGGRVFGRLDDTGGLSGRFESVAGQRLLNATAPYGDEIRVLVDRVGIGTATGTGDGSGRVAAPVGRAAGDARVCRAVTAAVRTVRAVRGVGQVRSPCDASPAAAGLRSVDGRAGVVIVALRRGLDRGAQDRVLDAVRARMNVLARALPGATVSYGGPLLVREETARQVELDTRRGELVALPISLAVLVVIFGGLLPAGIPVLGTLVSIAGALLALFAFSFVLRLDPNVVTVTTVLSLGLSIDYGLLQISRFREERAAGHPVPVAVERTAASAGRTVAFSGLTVALSLCGLFLYVSPFYHAMAAAGVSVVAVAVVATLTLTPALLGLGGARIRPARSRGEREQARRFVRLGPLGTFGPAAAFGPFGRRPHGQHRLVRPGDDGAFAALARATRRRPVPVVVVLTLVLLGLGVPFLRVNFQNGNANLLPPEFGSRRVAEALTTRFPGTGVDPIYVLARADPASLGRYAASIRNRPGVRSVSTPTPRGRGFSVVEVVPSGAGQDRTAQALVRNLRTDVPGFPTWVTGNTAALVDGTDEVRHRTPVTAGFVALAAIVLLFAMTGSLLVPLKALVMNVLSLGASFGALVLVFQDGYLAGLLGFTPTGGLETFVPVLVFIFAFGLSMDYEVFLLSRVKECYDAGASNDAAVERGLQRSGRIVTSAALLIVIVFAGFAAGRMLSIKELGLALALAVLVDATLVRCLLVPATMTLLGDANWWAPRPLRRLHQRFGLREHAPPPLAAPPAWAVAPSPTGPPTGPSTGPPTGPPTGPSTGPSQVRTSGIYRPRLFGR